MKICVLCVCVTPRTHHANAHAHAHTGRKTRRTGLPMRSVRCGIGVCESLSHAGALWVSPGPNCCVTQRVECDGKCPIVMHHITTSPLPLKASAWLCSVGLRLCGVATPEAGEHHTMFESTALIYIDLMAGSACE